MKREEIIAELDRRIHQLEPKVQREQKGGAVGQDSLWPMHEYIEILLSTIVLFQYVEASQHQRVCERLLEDCYREQQAKPGVLMGLLCSCKELLHTGFLARSRVLATADAMNDVLEQAEELLGNDYRDAACVLTGGALETTFNKMLEQGGYEGDLKKVMLKQKNDMLLKRDKYDKVTHGQVSAWAELRNDAAHGNYQVVRKEQVADFLKFTRDFIMRWFTPKLT
jgi:hypothetical protein